VTYTSIAQQGAVHPIEEKRLQIAISKWTVEQRRGCIFVQRENSYPTWSSIYPVVQDKYQKRLEHPRPLYSAYHH
jgi:hypothetical protein